MDNYELAQAMLPELRRVLHNCRYRYKTRIITSDGDAFISIYRRGCHSVAAVGCTHLGFIVDIYGPAVGLCQDKYRMYFEMTDPTSLDKVIAIIAKQL